MNNYSISLLNQAVSYLNQSNLDGAETILLKILQIEPKLFEALYLAGIVKGLQNKHLEASEFFYRAIKIKPKHPEVNFNYAKALSELGKHKESIKYHQISIQLAPKNSDAWLNYGKSHSILQNFKDALNCFENVLRVNPKSFEGLFNKSLILFNLNRFSDALSSLELSLELEPNVDYVWLKKGLCLDSLKDFHTAIECFDKALFINNDNGDTWNAKACSLLKLGQVDLAIDCFNKSIELNPNSFHSWFNYGEALHFLKRYELSIECLDKATSLNSNNSRAFFIKGLAYQELNLFHEALSCFNIALVLNSNERNLLSHLIGLKYKFADWSDLKVLEKLIASNPELALPFTTLFTFDSAELQSISSFFYSNTFLPAKEFSCNIQRTKGNKIRLGYFSSDFHTHAVSILTSELFELHNRNEFEIYGFSNKSLSEIDCYRERLIKSFDFFIDVSNLKDMDAINLIKRHEIDIAIDLGGHTTDTMTPLFSYRLAPIQINYIGFPGTLGTKFHDYIIADDHVIPLHNRKFFSEKIIYMPNSFQVNDSKRLISSTNMDRNTFNLPINSFIFCCFNNSHKINPQIFQKWINILSKVPNSVLWLNHESDIFKNNLIMEASKLDLDISRLYFAKRIPLSEYLERYRLADLFLDTLPFNAGTTASDALWAGLPVLTCSGKSFAGRMATSLLNAIELPELITNSTEEYVSKAIFLANNPYKLLEIRNKLQENRLTSPLFNTHLFVSHIEKAYKEIYQRYLRGDPPDHISVKDLP